MAATRDTEAVGWLRGVVVEADDLDLLAAFWGAVLGVGAAERFDDWVMLAPARRGASLAFQPRDIAGSDATPRMRPDLEVADLEAATRRIETLGGRLVDVVDEADGVAYHVMADPEGNEFAIVLPASPAG